MKNRFEEEKGRWENQSTIPSFWRPWGLRHNSREYMNSQTKTELYESEWNNRRNGHDQDGRYPYSLSDKQNPICDC